MKSESYHMKDGIEITQTQTMHYLCLDIFA